jgi:hypothetical protein
MEPAYFLRPPQQQPQFQKPAELIRQIAAEPVLEYRSIRLFAQDQSRFLFRTLDKWTS